jgi:hypothetical protein
MIAKMLMLKREAIPLNPVWVSPDFSKPRYISHSLTNPFNGGNAEIAILPMRIAVLVHGSRFIRPPSRSKSFVPVP